LFADNGVGSSISSLFFIARRLPPFWNPQLSTFRRSLPFYRYRWKFPLLFLWIDRRSPFPIQFFFTFFALFPPLEASILFPRPSSIGDKALFPPFARAAFFPPSCFATFFQAEFLIKGAFRRFFLCVVHFSVAEIFFSPPALFSERPQPSPLNFPPFCGSFSPISFFSSFSQASFHTVPCLSGPFEDHLVDPTPQVSFSKKDVYLLFFPFHLDLFLLSPVDMLPSCPHSRKNPFFSRILIDFLPFFGSEPSSPGVFGEVLFSSAAFDSLVTPPL